MPVVDRISSEDALERVKGALGAAVTKAELNHGHLDLTCAPKDLLEVVAHLRDGDGLGLRFFTFLSAVDRTELGDEPGPLEVLIHLYSPDHALHATIHVPVDLESPSCPSITGLFLGALWHERETHEMFGIDFEGHPRLTGLYLPEDFEGHPGRRSFKLPSRALVKDWPGAKDPEEAAAGGR